MNQEPNQEPDKNTEADNDFSLKYIILTGGCFTIAACFALFFLYIFMWVCSTGLKCPKPRYEVEPVEVMEIPETEEAADLDAEMKETAQEPETITP